TVSCGRSRDYAIRERPHGFLPAPRIFPRETLPGPMTGKGVTKPQYILLRVLCATALGAALACDQPCEPTPDGPGNQDPQSLEPCPPLPDGVEPIEGLAVAHAVDRFGGLTLTLSTRPLAC